MRKVYVYLAVTCHPHFWQYDRGLLRATVVTRGWNGYREGIDEFGCLQRVFFEAPRVLN